ncbi:MacB family efflux pump subunit [Andreprevotia lacus]|nr:MacB family efflux pump subunit [Andreprevotia lacus]
MAPLLELRGLVRRFPAGDEEVTVLHDVNLTIHAGEMVAIVGQSGSGKSTLMNILGCLDKPSGGSYRVAGRETGSLDTDELARLRREHFGFIFQRYHLLPHLSAERNVEIPAVYAGTDPGERSTRARQLLARLGLAEKTANRPGQLSGGQQQRVSIARALMNGGDVILADEPTGALDSHSGEEVMRILRELHQAGHTVIIVTHDMKVASNAERIIEISDGRIVADRRVAATAEVSRPVLQKPATRQRRFGLDGGRFGEAFKMALIAMMAHRMRTLLTMLGIIIGIAAVVSVVALGQGARQKVINDISAIGTNTIGIFPGRDWGDNKAPSIHTLLPGDVTALQSQFYLDSVTPEVTGGKTVRYRNIEVSAEITGVGEQYFRVKGMTIAEGASLRADDIRRQAQVAVIDLNTRNKLFPHGANPIGEIILVGSVPVRVIAVAIKPSSGFGGPDNNLNIWLPYTTAMGRLLGQNYFHGITVRVRDGMPNDLADQSLTKLLVSRHGSKDFFTFSSDGILKTVTQTTATLTLLVSSIAFISLAVGGIGVMNIMLVSVTERTREIGIRMAVGARQGDIMQQFLIEASLVCLLGGLIGVALSLGIGAFVARFLPMAPMIFSVPSIIGACVCSMLIGLVFGFLPARNAARLDPIEALARE